MAARRTSSLAPVSPRRRISLEAHSGLEMRKQHLDLLSFVPGSLELRRTGRLTGVIAGLFVDAALDIAR